MRRQTFIAPGWRFEEMIFGGHLIRLVERVRPSYPDRMSVSTDRVMTMIDIEWNLRSGRDDAFGVCSGLSYNLR
jgi:hypothetical protein